MFVKSTTYGKIEAAQKGASNTSLSLNQITCSGGKMTYKDITLNFQQIPNNPKFQDLSGKAYGKLLVLGFAGFQKKTSRWYCKCDCGNISIASSQNLKNEHSTSCGCYRKEYPILHYTKQGEQNKHSPKGEFLAYLNALKRCTDPKNKSYHRYGGRGIEFRFESYDEFLCVIGRKPSPKHSLNRIDNDGHYEKGNVEWATNKVQCRNRHTNKLIEFQGETKTLAEWAELLRVDYTFFQNRLTKGWCADCAFTIPKNGGTCGHK